MPSSAFHKRTLVREVCYALPNLSMAMLWTPLNVMQGIYIKHYGFSMKMMAAILLGSRVYDAIADLTVGTLSDWAKARTGRRKPLFALGGALFAVAGLFVYIPPSAPGPMYLTLWLLAFFTGYAALMISHMAWGAELAPGSGQKTALFGARLAAGYIGLCLFYSIPLLSIFKTTEITPETIEASACVAVAILIPALILAFGVVPEAAATGRPQASPPPGSLLRVAANRPFVALMGAYLLGGAGLGIWYGMIFIFVDIYLGRGTLFAPLYLLAFGVSVVSSFGWARLARLVGKKRAWLVGMGIAGVTVFATQFLSPHNATAGNLGLLLVANMIGTVSFELLPSSILGDVADYSMLKTGHDRTATYFSIHMFATKMLFALGGAIGLGLAAQLGFDPHAHEQMGGGVVALNVVMSWLPSLLLGAAMIAIHLIPMDERRHAIVRKRLDQRRARGSARSLASAST